MNETSACTDPSTSPADGATPATASDDATRAALEDVARLAAAVCGTAIGAVKLLHEDEPALEARVGICDCLEPGAEQALCSIAFDVEGVVVVSDAAADVRTAANPLVAGPPFLRFWAGVAVRDKRGLLVGVLCVADTVSRTLSPSQVRALEALARQVCSTLELRSAVTELTVRAAEHEVLSASRDAAGRELDAAFRYAPWAMSLSDARGRFVDVNAAFGALVGRTPDELRGQAVMSVVAPRSMEEERRVADALLSGEQDSITRIGELQRADGKARPVRGTTSIIRGADGQPHLFLTQAEDLSQRAIAEAALGVATGTIDAVLAIARDGRILFWNAGAERVFGYTTEEALGESAIMLVPERLRPTVLRAVRRMGDSPMGIGGRMAQMVARRQDGAEVAIELSITKEVIDTEVVYAAVARDVSARAALETRLRHEATHDRLTGVLTADAFTELVAERAARGAVAVARLDIADFHLINDSLGHGIGDEVLAAVAERLLALAPPGGGVARFGGDEFAVCFPANHQETARRTAEALTAAIAAPLPVYGRTLHLTASAGVSLHRAGEPVVNVLRKADTAMHLAKRNSRGGAALYDDCLREEAMARLDLQLGLRRALQEGELCLHYQPVIDLRTGEVTAVEALMRWNDPVRGTVSPALFIPAAEESGLIGEVDSFALRTATEQQARWAEEGIVVGVAVNVSVSELSWTHLAERVRAVRNGSNLPLALEVTESVLMQDIDLTAGTLGQLSGRGLSIAIDDFGTGYSSLAYLKRLPVDILKIDRSLLADVEQGDDAILRAIVSMANALGMDTVAEGIETEAQLDAVRDLGCDYAQGFHLGRPLSVEGATALLFDAIG